MLDGQETLWFLLVLLAAMGLQKGLDGMVFVLKLVANAHKKRHERFLVHTLRS